MPDHDGGKTLPLPAVVLRFIERAGVPYDSSAADFIEAHNLGPWKALLSDFPGISLKPLFHSIRPERIRKLQALAARRDPSYKPLNLMRFFSIAATAGTDLRALARAFKGWSSIDLTYTSRQAPDPEVLKDDPYLDKQGYLEPAEEGGIDAFAAWDLPGGDGEGQRFIDVERGWDLSHPDLSEHNFNRDENDQNRLLYGEIREDSKPHGTQVLGVVCACDNSKGIIGIAPHLEKVDVVSFHGENNSRESAILAAISHLKFGDVLLIEAQSDIDETNKYGPVEFEDANFAVIRLATALGIVVIEAAGNGRSNQENYSDEAVDLDSIDRFNPDDPLFEDSGAIIVTAATPTLGHKWMPQATYGKRVDCYAWGKEVYTCDPESNPKYSANFNGTSSAAAIVAGAALSVQGLAQAHLGRRFNSKQMREIFRNNGTPPDQVETHSIGVMPDLKKIIDNEILSPGVDLYIRDHLFDDGAPHTGPVSRSPDIILLNEASLDPQAEFGPGSGTEGRETLGSRVDPTKDNYIYVRMKNRGETDALHVTASVYWSEPSTLLKPEDWNYIGEVQVDKVEAGDVLTVSGPITWAKRDIPGAGQYCFIALAGNQEDPAPGPYDFLEWDHFIRFIRENNNVTWRNFNVITMSAPAYSGVSLPFVFPAAPDVSLPMDLEIKTDLPLGAKVLLEMPHAMTELFSELPAGLESDAATGTARLPVNPHGRRYLKELNLPAGSRTKLSLHVAFPPRTPRMVYELFARQLYDGREVGRVTWRFDRSGD